MNGFSLHPEAYADLEEIWEYIAADNVSAADRVIGDVFEALRTLAVSPHRAPAARPHIEACAIFSRARVSRCVRTG